MRGRLRIGMIYAQEVSNGAYRVQYPLEALARRGHDVQWRTQRQDGTLDLGALLTCDVVHIYRRADRDVVRAAERLVEAGVGLTWDNDDDITLMPKESPMYARYGGAVARRDFLAQRDIMRRVHVVTTTSGVLADRYRASGARSVHVIENLLADTSFMRFGGRLHEGFVIGWVAGMEHRADANRLRITDALAEVLERHPEVKVMTLGVKLNLPETRYRHAGIVDFARLPGYIRRFDIAIAPLADIPMSYARSDIKVKEYAACGVPWVASARGPYAELGPDQGGVLASDGAWASELDRLVRSRWERRRLRRKGLAWARAHAVDRRAGLWETVFTEAVAATRLRAPASS